MFLTINKRMRARVHMAASPGGRAVPAGSISGGHTSPAGGPTQWGQCVQYSGEVPSTVLRSACKDEANVKEPEHLENPETGKWDSCASVTAAEK